MSVSNDLKNEIINEHSKSSCCRRALLYGALFAKARVEGDVVTLSLEKSEFCEFISHLIKEYFNRTPEIYRPSSGGRCVMIRVSSPSAVKYLSTLKDSSNLLIQKCGGCLSSFLRGVFLASGRLSDPKKQYSLEFTLFERCDLFADFLREISLEPLISRRARGDIVYFRNSESIEDFFGYAGFNQAVFDLIEIKINSYARRETQRFMNCVSNNHNKMIDVAERQINLIKRLDELNLLSSLPEELEQTARMRMEYFDLPLSALAAKITPPISKSGLSHRLKNIEEMAKKLLDRSQNS